MCGALMILSGTVCSALASVYVDKTKRFDEVFKIAYGLATLGLISFAQVSCLFTTFYYNDIPCKI